MSTPLNFRTVVSFWLQVKLKVTYASIYAFITSYDLTLGGDDKRVLIWDIEKSLSGISNPRSLTTEQSSNIFCLGFDSKNRKLISGGNDALAISHDFET